jgi:hypothetical protein
MAGSTDLLTINDPACDNPASAVAGARRFAGEPAALDLDSRLSGRRETSACPGKVDAGFPTRACATQNEAEHIPYPLERDRL